MPPVALEPFDTLSRSEMAAVLDKLSLATVAVIGDFCLDTYWTIDRTASEISLETGLPTEPVRRQRYAPGGAGNVAMNLLALGASRVHLFGVLGDDPFGRELRRLLEHPHADFSGLLTQAEDWSTHAYLKPLVDGSELSRLDFGNFNQLAAATEDAFFERLEMVIGQVGVVLINQQSQGGIHDAPSFRRRLAETIGRHPEVCFIIDSRAYHEAYPRAVHKLNEREVLRSCGVAPAGGEPVSVEELAGYASDLASRWGAPLVVTRGERGCLVYGERVVEQIFGVQLPGRTDPVGAGDTFVSTLAATLSTGTTLAASAFAANMAAAVTAQKLFQTGTATPREILEMTAAADFAYHPELAESPRRAHYLAGTEIEVIAEPPPALEIRHAIFDHDGTISTLREGWEHIMEPMMVRAILGPQAATVEEAAYRRVVQRVREFIERTTGIQTITQMAGLVDLVQEFGFVPPEEVRTASAYKAAYNEELKAMVGLRLAKLDRGELGVDDFTLKGAVPFLQALAGAGVRLYLASGTDEDDVRDEAERLGYAGVFNGGIYGSVGDVAKDAKKVVIERILREVGGAFGQLATFGDGPVEMRETIRQGAYAVGIASDEPRRFGLNLSKRARLIRAGAQLIVPDLSQWEALWDLLRLPSREGN